MLDYLQGKTVLLTGAAGFLGSNLVARLLPLGSQVIGVDNLITGRMENLSEFLDDAGVSKVENFEFINGDVTKPVTEYLPANTKIDLILHFASPASPPRYQAHPVETYLVNSMGTHYLAEFLKSTNPEGRLLFAGTSEAYGNPQVHPQTEEYWGNVNPNGVRSCYDEAKRLGETICGVFNRDFGLDTRIVRIFNTYGPKMDPSDGRVIPNFVTQALKNQPLTIYGDGSFTRSYCFVDDLVEYILRMASKEGLAGETINIGNQKEYTITQTAEMVSEIINPGDQLQVERKPIPSDDPARRKPDITKAKSLLDYEPKVSFEDGLKKTIEYFRKVSN
jgi:nucleoside-diphosphate-sugar epimerase